LKCRGSGKSPRITPEDDFQRTIAAIADQVDAHLSGRSRTWLASFAELVATADESGVPMRGLAPAIDGLLGPDANGHVLEQEEREALIDALVGRWAATRYLAERDS